MQKLLAAGVGSSNGPQSGQGICSVYRVQKGNAGLSIKPGVLHEHVKKLFHRDIYFNRAAHRVAHRVVHRVVHHAAHRAAHRVVHRDAHRAAHRVVHRAVWMPENLVGLCLFPVELTIPLGIGILLKLTHKFVGHGYGNVEIPHFSLHGLAFNKIKYIGVIYPHHCHIRSVPALLLYGAKSGVVHFQKGHGT